jgi:guanylate kinase
MTEEEKQTIIKNIVIISGPSGAGEDSIINAVLRDLPAEKIITTTTRKMRAEDKEGVTYYFISQEEFKKGIANNEYIEYAKEYNDNYYGVSEKELLRVAKSGKIGIWKIEYKGVITAKKLFPNIKAIFINAPIEDLKRRIKKRDNLPSSYLEERMAYTKEWLKHRDIYDYEIENSDGNLEKAIEHCESLLKDLYSVDKTKN